MVSIVRTPEKDINKGKHEWNRNEKKNKGKKKLKQKQRTCAQGARRVPRGQGCWLLVFAGTISPMVCPVDESTRGRHEKTRRKTRQEDEGRGTELNKQNEQSYVQLVGQGRHKRPQRKEETKG